MTGSMVRTMGEPVTASSMQKARESQSNIDYQKTIPDQMMKTVGQEERVKLLELRKLIAYYSNHT